MNVVQKKLGSFKKLAAGIEGLMQPGYRVIVSELQAGEEITHEIEGTDICVPYYDNELEGRRKAAIAFNQGNNTDEWIMLGDGNPFWIRNFPFYCFHLRNTDDEIHIIKIVVFTNPFYVIQLNNALAGK